jgi:hypothetical protein
MPGTADRARHVAELAGAARRYLDRYGADRPLWTVRVAAALRTLGVDRYVEVDPAGTLRVLDPDATTVGIPAPGLRERPTGTGLGTLAWGRAALDPLVAHLGTGRRIALCVPEPLAGVPWHGRTDLVVSYVDGGDQLVDLAARPAVPVDEAPVFLANPLGDRDVATMEVLAIRRLLYPRSVGLGRTGEPGERSGTPDDVLEHLHASLLHLHAGTDRDALLLADGTLSAQRIRAHGGAPGGLVVLPAGTTGLALAFLAAGAHGVVVAQWPVPPAALATLMFTLHHALVDRRLPPAMALHEVRRWAADPDRVPPPDLPGYLHASGTDLADPAVWAAFRHYGR